MRFPGIKKFIFACVCVLLNGIPISQAAGDTVYQVDTKVEFSSPDTTITILAGSTAKEITVTSSNLSITLEEGDEFVITSTQYAFSISGDLKVSNRKCDQNTEIRTFTGSGTSTVSFIDRICPVDGDGSGNWILIEALKNQRKMPDNFPFTDVQGHVSYNAVKTLWEMGVLNGRTSTLFYPDSPLTRAEALKIVLLTFDYDISDKLDILKDYSDIDQNEWYASYVATAIKVGIAEGYGNNIFKPEALINRAESLKILLLASGKDLNTGQKSPFEDVKKEYWFSPFVNYAYSKGLTSNQLSEKFAPFDFPSRAEMVMMTVKALGI